MSYRLEVSRTARKDLEALPVDARRRVGERISRLGEMPVPPDARAMAGEWAGFYRLRVGEYRVVYHVDTTNRTIGIVRVGHRSSVYK